MKIVILSDIHDNLVNLKKCLNWCRKNKISELIVCGDITNGETLRFLSENFSGQIHAVKGNVCLFSDKEIGQWKNIKYYGEIGRFQLDGIYVGLCHGPYQFDELLKLGKCQIIFFGHTHKPYIKSEEKEGVVIQFVNPGTLGGVFQRPTFSFWDTGKRDLELKALDL